MQKLFKYKLLFKHCTLSSWHCCTISDTLFVVCASLLTDHNRFTVAFTSQVLLRAKVGLCMLGDCFSLLWLFKVETSLLAYFPTVTQCTCLWPWRRHNSSVTLGTEASVNRHWWISWSGPGSRKTHSSCHLKKHLRCYQIPISCIPAFVVQSLQGHEACELSR